jgi:hypothetical protein
MVRLFGFLNKLISWTSWSSHNNVAKFAKLAILVAMYKVHCNNNACNDQDACTDQDDDQPNWHAVAGQKR